MNGAGNIPNASIRRDDGIVSSLESLIEYLAETAHHVSVLEQTLAPAILPATPSPAGPSTKDAHGPRCQLQEQVLELTQRARGINAMLIDLIERVRV